MEPLLGGSSWADRLPDSLVLNLVLEFPAGTPQCRHVLTGETWASRAAYSGLVPACDQGSYRQTLLTRRLAGSPAPQHLADGRGDLVVAQAVDERVEQRRHVGVDQRQRAVPVRGVAGFGPRVHEGGAAVVQEGDGQVRGAGGDGLAAAPRRAQAVQGAGDGAVRGQDEQRGQQQQQQAGAQQRQLLGVAPCAGQVQQRCDVAEEVHQQAGAAEGQVEDGHREPHGHRQAPEATGQGQPRAQRGGHHRRVAERVADGHVAVISHGGQQEALGPAQGHEHLHLHGAAQEGDGTASAQARWGQVSQGAGHHHQRVTELDGWQLAQEEVHGRPGGRRGHGQQDEQVPAQGGQVQGQQQQEECWPQVWKLWKAPQEKAPGQGGVAGAGHAPTCPGPEAPVGKKQGRGSLWAPLLWPC